jgi:hypothetical protein
MFDQFIEKMQDSISDYLLGKVKETGNGFWDNLTDKQKKRTILVIKSVSRLPLDAIFDDTKQKSLNMDLKSALNAISGDAASTLMSARGATNDPVCQAIFDLGIALLSGKKKDKK